MRKGKGTVICYLLPRLFYWRPAAQCRRSTAVGQQIKALISQEKEDFTLRRGRQHPHHQLLIPDLQHKTLHGINFGKCQFVPDSIFRFSALNFSPYTNLQGTFRLELAMVDAHIMESLLLNSNSFNVRSNARFTQCGKCFRNR